MTEDRHTDLIAELKAHLDFLAGHADWRHTALDCLAIVGRIEALYAPPVQQEGARSCTCHPDDNPPVPCAQKFALSERLQEGPALSTSAEPVQKTPETEHVGGLQEGESAAWREALKPFAERWTATFGGPLAHQVASYLGFEGGGLSINLEGYPDNGAGHFTFTEDDLEPLTEFDDETGARWDGYLVKLPSSELLAIRDFLNQHIPPRTGTHPTPTGDAPWSSMESAPRDGTFILAQMAMIKGESRWSHLSGRTFVIRHEGSTRSDLDLGWSVYPGLGGAPDEWFSRWQRLPGSGVGG